MISWFEKHNKLSLTLTLFIALSIFYLSSKPFPGLPSPFSYLSTLYHFFAFFFLAFFLLITLTRGKPSSELITLAILISLAYAISDEIHQFFIPGRYCSFLDILTDFSGIFTASLIYSIKISKKKPTATRIIF
jgi:VanZ family protein